MSSHTCPDWPTLMELAPELQFRHCTLGEVHLPPEAFVQTKGIPIDAVVICCDIDSHVFHAPHTDPRVAVALERTHWIELREWAGGRRRGSD